MGLIVDASVAVKWFIDETDSEAAHLILDREAGLLAPDLLVVEVCNTAWRRARLGDISPAQCRAIADRIVKTPVEMRPNATLAPAAASIALALDHAIYDCFYLALAESEGLRLVTADRRFLAKLAGTRWQDHAVVLGQR
jgi:predicted nucleic acid-binding protein